MNIFAKRLVEAMDRTGITSAELSRRTGIPDSMICNYRKGDYKPKQDRLYLISKALNISASWLMGFDGPETEGDLDSTISALMSQLNEEQKSQALDYIRYLAAKKTD